MAILSDRTDYTIRNIRSVKEAHFIKIKIPQAYVRILPVYILRRRVSKWAEAETNSNERRNRQIHNYTSGFQHSSIDSTGGQKDYR